ncbi:Ig-like domain-containing protein, partial [Chlorobium limicola]|uniref:Ig-like domain-containing protein n=1 Tax=Chlorobium limicola TaxID=1092 RepID=UPI000A913FE6
TIADKLIATAGTRDIFTLEIDQTSGAYTYTLLDQLDHTGSLTSGSSDSQILSLDLSGGLAITDRDGDRITIDTGSLVITVEDDIPIAYNVPILPTGSANINEATFLVTEGGDPAKSYTENAASHKVTGNVIASGPSTHGATWPADKAGADDPIKVVLLEYNDGGTWKTVSADGSALYGKITMTDSGTFEYISYDHSNHPLLPVKKDYLVDTFRYTIEDADGDRMQANFDVVVLDTVPTLTALPNVSVNEANLPLGSDPKPPLLIKTTTFIITPGEDEVDVKFNFSVDDKIKGTLAYKDLTSLGEPVYYAVTDTLIIAYTYSGPGTPAADYVPDPDEYVFIQTIDNTPAIPTTTFTLYKPLDHTLDISTIDPVISPNRYITLPFAYEAFEPDDNDALTSTFTIVVFDDKSAEPAAVTLDEDTIEIITTNADAHGGSSPNISVTTAPSHGTAEVQLDGTIKYTPVGHYSGPDVLTYTYTNDEGVDIPVTVTITVNPISDAPGVQTDYEKATPEDQPVLLGLTVPVITDKEDETSPASDDIDNPERLGLITLTGIPAGAKLLDGTGGGNTLLATSSGLTAPITIYINDIPGYHLSTLSAADATLSLTTAQFEALKVLPPADDAEDFEGGTAADNFTVTMSVTEYEVNSSGVKINAPDQNGKTSDTEVSIDVTAVTDRVDLSWMTAAADLTATPPDSFVPPVPGSVVGSDPEDGTLKKWISEDQTLRLDTLLTYNANDPADFGGVNGNDDDGTETRWIVIGDPVAGTLPSGTTVWVGGEQKAAESDGTYRIDLVNYDNDLPKIEVKPPADFSGNIEDIKITLYAQDTDEDSTVTTLVKEDSVKLTLYVKPVGDDVAAPDVSTPEDQPVRFMEDLRVTDALNTGETTGGTEIITEIIISDLTAGWVIRNSANAVVFTGNGTADYTVLSADVDSGAYKDYTITPPAHSSADTTVKVLVTTTDTATVDGYPAFTDTKTDQLHSIKVTVTPVAEVIGADDLMDGVSDDLVPLADLLNGDAPAYLIYPDSDGDGDADLQMNRSFTFSVSPVEDQPFKFHDEAGAYLDATGTPATFDFKSLWNNVDADTVSPEGSEKTYALLEPMYKDGTAYKKLYGSTFTYVDGSGGTHTLRYKGDPVEIPAEYLDTVTFTPVAHFAGPDVKIVVQAKTVDFDQDHPGEPAYADTKITGMVELYFDVTPVADDVTLAVTSPVGVIEDNELPLSIRPTSSDKDGSESFRVVISGIPDGSRMTYNGNVIYATTDTSGSVPIENFDSSLPLTILPPLHSNVDFDLSVTAYAVESDAFVSTGPVSQTLTITVDITGDADGVTVGVQPKGCVEELVDQYGCQIPMSQVINSVAPIDTDGSESVSGYFTGLPEGFDIVGTNVAFLGGEGTSRRWVLTPDDLSGTYLSVPENYSGTVTFNGIPVTTENDGDTWTGPVLSITKTVTPSPEATIATSTSFNEDQFVRVDFDIEYQNGDTDEVLESVWIKASDVDSKSFTLYYDADDAGIGSPIAFGQPGMVADSDGYYKLTGEQSEHIYVQNEHDVDGTYNFEIQYAIKDPTSDGTMVPLIDLAGNPVLDTFGAPVLVDHITVWTTDSYTLQVNSVTDPIDATLLSITPDDRVSGADSSVSGNTVTVFGSTMLEVKVMVGQRDDTAENPGGKDIDESEVLQRFVIDGVPDGISVVGGTYIGDTDTTANTGRWIIDVQPDAEFDNNDGIEQTIFFNIDGTEDQLASSGSATITITAESRDMGSNPPATVASGISTASTSFTVKIDPAFVDDGAVYAPPAEITSWQFDTAFNATEDTSSSLADLTNAAISDSGNFSITLKNIPDGTIVSGMERTVLPGGEVVYTASGTGDNAHLQTLLHSITLTPPANRNENNFNDQFAFDLTLTTYAEGAQQNVETFHAQPEVYPVSDPTAIVITPRGIEGEDDVNPGLLTDSGEDVQFTVSFRNDEDYGNTELVGDLMLTITDSGMDVHSGVLLDGSNSVITPDSVGADYAVYKISGVSYADSLTFTYVPVEHSSGSVRIDASMDSKETPLSDPPGTVTLPAIGATTIDVIPVIDGYRVDSITASGNEDTRIKVVLVNPGLVDTDGSESVQSILLENVPNGYMVYIINDATGEKLALNAGDDGLGHNTWSLGSTMPSYIAIQPPKNVSGTVDNISLSVYTIEDGLDTPLKQSFPFDLEVLPVVDGLTINPTHTFGIEGELIPINLNASMADFDGSETATVTLHGLGKYVRFFGDGSAELTGVSYEESSDTYTLSGLTVADTNALSFIQSARVIGTPGVTVTAVTYENGSTTPSTTVMGGFTLDISEASPTTNADTLLYDGTTLPLRTYDGLAGDDTLVLRQGEGITFDAATTGRLKNIEILDLSVSGVNAVTSLDASDVLAVTDVRNTLYILGDGDTVSGAGWGVSSGSSTETINGSSHNFTHYTVGGATVKIETSINESMG